MNELWKISGNQVAEDKSKMFKYIFIYKNKG